MFLRNLILSVVILCTATMAQAQNLDGHGRTARPAHWEFTMQTVYTASQDITREGGSSLSLQDNLGWGFGLAFRITPRFTLGMGFNWSSINYNAVIVNGEDPTETHRYSNKMDISTTLITGKYNILDGPFTPYVSGSLGWSLIDTNIFAGFADGCYWDPWWGYVCGPVATSYGTSAAAYGLGLGGRLQVTPKFFMSASYDFQWLDIDAVDSNNLFRMSFGFLH